MANSLVDQLNRLLQKHGMTLPPAAEREQLWGAVASQRDEQVLEEFKQFLYDKAPMIHGTLSGEIWKILIDSGRE
jgi:hypothetical protein